MHRWFALCVVMACSEPVAPSGPVTTSYVVQRQIPLLGQPELDLLFVVDNSPAMAAHRANLSANAHALVAAIEGLQFGMPDLHLGVITTDVGTRGAEDNSASPIAGCTVNGDAGIARAEGAIGNFFTDRRLPSGNRELNYEGSLDDALAATFDALPTGCAFPRPLEAVRRAIANPANTGFLREDAILMVAFLTANDDCSFRHSTFLAGADAFSCIESTDLVAVAEIAAALKATKSDPTKVIVAGGFGPAEPFTADAQTRTVEPSCSIDQRSAQPGVRLQAFLDEFPHRNTFSSLCSDDLVPMLELILQPIRTSLGAACFEQTIPDINPDTPGDQFDCAAWFRFESGDEAVLPRCDDSNQTCWQIAPDPIICTDASKQKLELENWFPPSELSLLILECAVRTIVE